jgi:hypothetical protein
MDTIPKEFEKFGFVQANGKGPLSRLGDNAVVVRLDILRVAIDHAKAEKLDFTPRHVIEICRIYEAYVADGMAVISGKALEAVNG